MELLRGIAFSGLFTGGTGKQQVAPFFSTDKDGNDDDALFAKEDEERGRQLQLLVVVLDDHGTICRRQ